MTQKPGNVVKRVVLCYFLKCLLKMTVSEKPPSLCPVTDSISGKECRCCCVESER